MNNYYDVYDNEAMRANANYDHMTANLTNHTKASREPDYEDNES